MIAYKIAYIAFVISFIIGNVLDKDFQMSRVRIANFIIVAIVFILQIIGVM